MVKQQPIDNITWLKTVDLVANEYNPNVVLDQELKLLKFSILKQGWLQPILVTKDYKIIDGYHRYWLALNDKDIQAMTSNRVPCCIMDMDEAERMMLTIRINRAKGNHVSFKMHEIITELFNTHKKSVEQISEGIGANKHEVNLLLEEGVFTAKNIKEHKYSKAWIPAKKDLPK